MNNLRIPDDVKHVEGCTCAGSGEIHALDCALQNLPAAEAHRRVDSSTARVKVYVDQMMGGR